MVIRHCLSLTSKSAAASDDARYNENTGTGFVILPSRRCLQPQEGFIKDTVNELLEKVKHFSDNKKSIFLQRIR